MTKSEDSSAEVVKGSRKWLDNQKASDRGRAHRAIWGRVYRARIRAGKERCRLCGLRSTDLTFDHIVPFHLGGRLKFNNTTILCLPCNKLKGGQPGWTFLSLLEEEMMAPPEEQWAALEFKEVASEHHNSKVHKGHYHSWFTLREE